MANTEDLHAQAVYLATSQSRSEMVATIEKELLHYEILDAMDEAGLLDLLVFQGGTSLRLCYGAERYSEDLDFSGGRGFDRSGLDELTTCIEQAVASRYHVDTVVNTPRDSGSLVSAWTVVIDTVSGRRDVAHQRIRIEVASIDAHDPVIRALNVNYEGLADSYSDVMLKVESREEILADKIEAFVCSNHLRYRDLWDLAWLSKAPGIDLTRAMELRDMKAVDYKEVDEYAQRLPLINDKLDTAFASSGFITEMSRFLPSTRIARTIKRPLWLEGTRQQLTSLFAMATPKTAEHKPGSSC